MTTEGEDHSPFLFLSLFSFSLPTLLYGHYSSFFPLLVAISFAHFLSLPLSLIHSLQTSSHPLLRSRSIAFLWCVWPLCPRHQFSWDMTLAWCLVRHFLSYTLTHSQPHTASLNSFTLMQSHLHAVSHTLTLSHSHTLTQSHSHSCGHLHSLTQAPSSL